MSATILPSEQGFVYKWIYKPTGEYYIGIHKGTTDDGYIGSGVLFRRKFTNTSRDHWEREVLFEGDYWTECLKKEKELVNWKTLKEPLCLNLAVGGKRGRSGSSGPSLHAGKRQSYRCKPQEIILDGTTYPTRMIACKKLSITFEELDARLIHAGWQKSCKYNRYNRY